MLRRSFAVCACTIVALLMGAGTEVTIEDADLVYLEGAGEVAVVNGTEVYRTRDEQSGNWKSLFTRNDGGTTIVLSADAGSYDMQVWSVAANPANPSRVHTVTTLDVGDGGGPVQFVDSTILLGLLAAWGPCGPGSCPYDLNGDGNVDVQDLLAMLAMWGQPWPG